jgi:DNA-binding FrmR family transcriptional regulator
VIGVTGVRLAHLVLHGAGFAGRKRGLAKPDCLAIYTPKGYLSSTLRGYEMNEVRKKSVTALKRIEGQVRGVAKMIEDDRYCIDIVTQITAVRAALSKVETDLLREHMGHCVSTAMKSRDPAEQERVINELMAVFRK